MARYKDLYTPARDYGQVYRSGLRQRTEAQERSGQSMVDFAGDIYNLVRKEKQAKAEAQKNKMLEQEYLSQQNYRTSRIQQEKENQDFNRYQSQLKNLVSMHDTWIKQDDANMYKRWGGIARTRSAYQQRVKQIEKAIENAQTPEARRAVVMRYPGWFEHTKKMNQQQLKTFFDSYDHGLHMASAMPFSLVTEEDYVNSMVSPEYKDDKGNIISKTNPYQESLRAMLRHPKWGFADMVADADKIKDEIEHSKNSTPKVGEATGKKAESMGDLLESPEDSAANPNITEKEAEAEAESGKKPGMGTLLEGQYKDPVPIEETADTAIEIAANIGKGDADTRREDARSDRRYTGRASTIDTSPPDLSKEAQGEWSNAKDLLNDGGQKYLLINDPVTTFLVDNTLHSLGLPHALSKQGNLMYHSEEEMKDKATKALAAWNNFKQMNKEFWKGPWDVTKIIPEFDSKSAPQAMQSVTVMEGIEHSNPWLKDLPEDKKPLVGMIEEAMFEARSGLGKIKYQPSLALAGATTSVMPWKRNFETPIVSAKDLIDRKMVQKRIQNFNDFKNMHKAMKEGRWKDAYTELVKSRIGETLLSTESGRNRLKVIEQMATGEAALTYTRPIQYLPDLEDDKPVIKAEMEQVGGIVKDKEGNIIMKPMPGMVYDGQQATIKPVVEPNEVDIRKRVLPADAVNMAWKKMTLATDNVTNVAEEDLPLEYKLMRMSQEKGDFGPNNDLNQRIRSYESIQSMINRNRSTP